MSPLAETSYGDTPGVRPCQRGRGIFDRDLWTRPRGVGGPGHRRGVVDKKCPAQPGTGRDLAGESAMFKIEAPTKSPLLPGYPGAGSSIDRSIRIQNFAP